MDGRGRPVKEDERLSSGGNPARRDDEQQRQEATPQNGFEGVREAQGSRRPSTTMGADSALHFEQMASLDGRQEQDEMLLQQRRRNGQRRGSRTNLEEVIEYNTSSASSMQPAAASSFIYALQQQRQQQQQMQQQMTAGGLKTFPAPSPPAYSAAAVDWSQLPPEMMMDSSAYEPPAEPERPIAARGRRPSIGQLF
jgi:hypothetical protein